MVEPKISRNIHLAPYPTAAGTPSAVGYDVRGGANGRLYYPMRPDSCRRGHGGRSPSAVAHGVRSPRAVPYSGRVLAPWVTAAASPLYKGATAAAASPPAPPL
jgi:hypothetical protein